MRNVDAHYPISQDPYPYVPGGDSSASPPPSPPAGRSSEPSPPALSPSPWGELGPRHNSHAISLQRSASEGPAPPPTALAMSNGPAMCSTLAPMFAFRGPDSPPQ